MYRCEFGVGCISGHAGKELAFVITGVDAVINAPYLMLPVQLLKHPPGTLVINTQVLTIAFQLVVKVKQGLNNETVPVLPQTGAVKMVRPEQGGVEAVNKTQLLLTVYRTL
jgi:hypothetical protein